MGKRKFAYIIPFAFSLKVSGYPGSHGIPAMAGSIYPGQASLLDQTDSWNHRPQEIPVWQPNMEVSWTDTPVDALCTVNTLFYSSDTSGDYCRRIEYVSWVFFKLPSWSRIGVMTEFSSFWTKSSYVRLDVVFVLFTQILDEVTTT